MTREQMIFDLTAHDLKWMRNLDDRSAKLMIDDWARFFTRGGYKSYTDEQLRDEYLHAFNHKGAA